MSAEVWALGDAYEPYVGRWSRLVAADFLRWLDIADGCQWADVGCGTGAVTEAVLRFAAPARVIGIDQSEGFLAYARAHVTDPRAGFQVGTATALSLGDGEMDATISGLVLNFVPEPERAVAEMTRVTRTDGVIGAYVWDYADGAQFIRHFWDAAVELDPQARDLYEGTRFPLCHPDALASLFTGGGLAGVEVSAIDVPTRFRDFDDYWLPFLGGQGPAPGYAVSLAGDRRADLRELIRTRLPIEADGQIALTARAWAVRGRR
ncbi:class I SAM-dependent methyltransferase [Acrocarpospora sp. B8E8]|uniref:class I SAM-dependent methyltransferase n=1 Tax=Acrocarpospora sp. B8E8 TaxID=3153572 RepID=UPI00325CFF97